LGDWSVSDALLWMVAGEVSAQQVASVVAAVGSAHDRVDVERFGLVVVEEDALVAVVFDQYDGAVDTVVEGIIVTAPADPGDVRGGHEIGAGGFACDHDGGRRHVAVPTTNPPPCMNTTVHPGALSSLGIESADTVSRVIEVAGHVSADRSAGQQCLERLAERSRCALVCSETRCAQVCGGEMRCASTLCGR
jgi:hypothetical protein